MLKIVPYEERFEEQLSRFDSDLAAELGENEDIILRSAVLCLNGAEIVGAACLRMSPDFKALKQNLAYHHLDGIFKTAESGAGVEVEAAVLLLNSLKKNYEEIQKAFLGKRIILRLFASAERTAFIEFLGENGFFADRPFLKMQRMLEEQDACEEAFFEADGQRIIFKEIDLEDPDMAREYTRVSSASFRISDSLTSLRFRKRHGTGIYGAVIPGGALNEQGLPCDKLLSSVCIWKEDSGTATENIISDPAYRRKGITGALLRYIFGILRQEGEESVQLSLFSDNLAALRFYIRMGYEVTGVTLSMHYEINYEFRPY